MHTAKSIKAIFTFGILTGLLFANPVLFNRVYAESEDLPTSIYVTFCGNNIVEPGEFCDDGEDNRSYVSGTEEHFCSTDCLGWAPYCGDALVQSEFGELCDRNSSQCTADDNYKGTSSCNTSCDGWMICNAYEYCGDGSINGNELCDSNSRSCTKNGYRGVQSCNGDCDDYGSCVTSESCGDGIVNGDEVCDGNSRACETVHEYPGTQSCNSSCSGWSTCQSSEYCGDGIVNGDEECDGSSSCTSKCVVRTSGGGGGGGGGSTNNTVTTKVILQGRAYPNSSVTVLKDGEVATVVKADDLANFKATISDIQSGLWTFGLWSEDKYGNRSITFSFTVNVSANIATTVNGIFLPPTISVDKSAVQKGETINIMGQTAPTSRVDITVNSEEPGITNSVTADNYGAYYYPFNTWLLENGSHSTRSKATDDDGAISGYSNTVAFTVGNVVSACARNADINSDNRVNLVDFSILLYNWTNLKNKKADINCDGRASLVDFSIMMYQWTG